MEQLGLVRMGARWYAPDVGRWVTADPLFLEEPKRGAERPLELSLYAYATGCPTVKVDPNGTAPLLLVTGPLEAAAGAAGSVIGQVVSGVIRGQSIMKSVSNIQGSKVASAALVGLAAGLGAPYLSTTMAGAVGLSSVANVVQTGIDAAVEKGMPTPSELLVSGIVGGIGGGIGGSVARGGAAGVVFDEAGRFLPLWAARAMNQSTEIAAATASESLARNSVGSVVGNIDFSPLMPGGQSSAPQTEKDVK